MTDPAAGGEPDKVEVAADWRSHEPVTLDIGPVLHADDAVANKMAALYGRALTAAGAVCCDVLADGRWQLSGHQLKQRHAGLPALLASRPFLEGHVRERVFRLPNIGVRPA